MKNPFPTTRVTSSKPHTALHPILVLCACAVLAGAPDLLAAHGAGGGGKNPAAREIPDPPVITLTAGPGFTVRSATPGKGIDGELSEGGASISFTSHKAKGLLAATITGADGAVLYEYREVHDKIMRMETGDGSEIELRRPPELRVKGVLYGSSTPAQLEALRSLAASPEGRLIRRLGIELLATAPGGELVAERRGLELATQALWPHFAPGGPAAPPLTMDYEVSSSGYVVLTQPSELVLAVNRAAPVLPWEKHNDNAVNECLGRCGSGCTGGILGVQIYSSHWTDTYGSTFGYQQEVRCVAGEDWVYTWYATPTTHSVTGLWTPGCQLHDNCCRLNPLVCGVVCSLLIPNTAIEIQSDPLGELRTWTYTDYSWSITQQYVGYSGCTCPGVDPRSEDFECVQ